MSNGYNPNGPPYRPSQAYNQPSTSYRPPVMPPRPNTTGIDSGTLQRLQALELKNASLESRYDNQIRELQRQVEEQMIQVATKDSLLEDARNQLKALSQSLAKEQSARMDDRLKWSQEQQQRLDQRRTGLAGDDESQIQKLLSQLQIERQNNQQFSKYLEQINHRHEGQLQELQANYQQESAKMKNDLEDERKANELLDESLRVLKNQLDDLLATSPVVAPPLIGEVIITPQQHDQLKETLRQERETFEAALQKKQQEIFELNQALDWKSRPDQNLHDNHRNLQSSFHDMQEHSISLQQQLDNVTYQLAEAQRQIDVFAAREAIYYTQNFLNPLPQPLKIPKDYSPELFGLFVQVGDAEKGTGKLDVLQLQTTLNRADNWPPLSLKSSATLMRLVGIGAAPDSKFTDFCDLIGFRTIFDWVATLKKVFSRYDQERSSETVWGYLQLSPETFKGILAELALNMHPKAISLLLNRLSLESVAVSWDAFVTTVSLVKLWDLEFGKLDLDKDQAITIYHQVFMITVAKCLP